MTTWSCFLTAYSRTRTRFRRRRSKPGAIGSGSTDRAFSKRVWPGKRSGDEKGDEMALGKVADEEMALATARVKARILNSLAAEFYSRRQEVGACEGDIAALIGS